MNRSTLKTVERVLNVTGMIALGLGVVFGFGDLKGWFRHADRQAFLQWALHQESGLPIHDLAAQAFMGGFPPPSPSDLEIVTHVTKWKMRVEGRPVLEAAFKYMRSDQSRTEYVATLPQVREWATESSYPWLSWILTVIGFLEVLGGKILGRWI
jgi:hypothetical protein